MSEKKKPLLCTSCGRVHCVSFDLFRALQGVGLYLSGYMQYLNAPWLKRCSQSSLLITCNTCPTVFSLLAPPDWWENRAAFVMCPEVTELTQAWIMGEKNIAKIRSAGVTQEHFCQIWTHLLSGGSYWVGLWPHQVTSAGLRGVWGPKADMSVVSITRSPWPVASSN